MLGDVVISTETASRQARRFNHSLDVELRRLLTHGILHLIGHDHIGDRARAARMRAEERRLLRLFEPQRPTERDGR